MKDYFVVLVFCAGCVLHGCGESLNNSRFSLEFPEIPQVWELMLGDPHWQLEWFDDKGRKETLNVRGNASVELNLPPTLASAVCAQPFWPDKGIRPGVFKPAGAIFPFDVSGESLVLSWQGGVEAVLFQELINAAAGEGQATRLPWNFNWPRFRELFDDPSLNEEVRANPWLADWPGIAAKIVQSGFDKRRLVPETRSELSVPVSGGPWIGASPFAAPLFFEAVPVFPVRAATDTWVCTEGLLRCNTQAWIFHLWE